MHWKAVKKLRSELDKYGISYKKPTIPSHVTAVEFNSTDLVDNVEKRMAKAGYYVQGRKCAHICKYKISIEITK